MPHKQWSGSGTKAITRRKYPTEEGYSASEPENTKSIARGRVSLKIACQIWEEPQGKAIRVFTS